MRAFQVFLIVGLFSALGGHANAVADAGVDPEALKAARELSAIVSKDTLVQVCAQMSSVVWPDVERKLSAKQTISAEQATSLRAEFERIQVDFMSRLMDDAPAIYARHFSASELRELIAFYRTPIGKKAISVLPQVTSEIMALIMPQLPKVQSEVMKSFGKILRKRGLTI
jgi:hypothetical protein